MLDGTCVKCGPVGMPRCCCRSVNAGGPGVNVKPASSRLLLPVRLLLAAVCAAAVGRAAAAPHGAAPPSLDVTDAAVVCGDPARPADSVSAGCDAATSFLRRVMRQRGAVWPAAAARVGTAEAPRFPPVALHVHGAMPGACPAACSSQAFGAAVRHPHEGGVLYVETDPDGAVVLHVAATSPAGWTQVFGRLARLLDVTPRGRVVLPARNRGAAACAVHAPPAWAHTRGHQFTDWLAYFHTTSAAFDYVDSLAAFGTNQIEFAHLDWARGDLATLQSYSKHLQNVHMNMSVWYPLNLCTCRGCLW